MDFNPVAKNIRKLREARHWSQEELALASGVDARTIQRAEAGRPLSVETLKALASAFDSTIESLQLSDEALEAAVREFEAKYKIIDMHIPTSSSDIGEMVGATEALMLQRVGELTEGQLDMVAELEELLRDYGDIWRDMEIAGRRDAEKLLFRRLAELREAGVTITFGTERMGLRTGTGTRFTMHVLHVACAKGDTPLGAIIREKNGPISFNF